MSSANSNSSSISDIVALFSGRSSGKNTPSRKRKGNLRTEAEVHNDDPDSIVILSDNDDFHNEFETDPPLAGKKRSKRDHGVEKKFMVTSNDPMGNILMRLLEECTEQARKNNKTMSLGVDELCEQFYNHKISERQKLNHKVQLAAENWGNDMLQKELNSHTLFSQLKPPTRYAPGPTLETNRQTAEVLKLLPSGGHKFNGDPRKMSVLEYLFSLNMMQSQCNLSEPEFLQMMLASTTGEPHLMLMRRVQEKDDVENIYHNLLLHYDKRIEPEEARIKLHSYKAPRNASLA